MKVYERKLIWYVDLIAYTKPHILKVNGNDYLLFDECDDIFINGYEKIIRLITLKDKKFDNGNLKLEVITVDLDNIKNNKIKELLEKVKDTFKENEFD